MNSTDFCFLMRVLERIGVKDALFSQDDKTGYKYDWVVKIPLTAGKSVPSVLKALKFKPVIEDDRIVIR